MVRRVLLTLLAAAIAAGTIVGWRLLRGGADGPLDGGSGAGATLPGTEPGTMYSIGSLFLSNVGSATITVESVDVVPGGGGLTPLGPARVSGPDRIDPLGDAGFITMPGGPPGRMPLADPKGYTLPPAPQQTVEVVYAVVTPPAANSWIAGVDITYRVGIRRYKERFHSVLSICTPEFVGECPDHSDAAP